MTKRDMVALIKAYEAWDPGSCNEIQEMDDNDPAKNDRKDSKVIAGQSKGKAF